MTAYSWMRGGLLLMALAMVGCGGSGDLKTYKIPGKLVYEDNSPVPGASLVFQTEVNGQTVTAQGMANPDGTFQLSTVNPDDGVVAGEHKVSVSPLPAGDGAPAAAPAVPPVYWELGTSGLTSKVEPSTKEIVVTINRQGK